MAWSPSISAQVPPPINGPTEIGEICMQKVFGTPVTNSNALGCTASDIKIARAISVFPKSCTQGTKVNLKGTFEVVVTANVRYDSGFFFRLDGGKNARGDGASASGICSLSKLDPTIPKAFNGDGDTCGDLAAGTYAMTFDIPNVDCDDKNNDRKLDLPNCVSWHSNAGTACQIGNPFTFNPETKSKCNCDDNFSVDVIVEPPTTTVDKVASPLEVDERGDAVTFSVSVKNDATVVSATLTTLEDKLPNGTTVNLLTLPACVGGTATAANPGPCTHATASPSCPSLLNKVLAPQASATCQFQMYLAGNAGASLTDVANACITTTTGKACDTEDATVVVTDLISTPKVTKTATAVGCTIDATYTVDVDNPSPVDLLKINSLIDNRFGDITVPHAASGAIEQVLSTNCVAGGWIPVNGNYSCTFKGRMVSGDCNANHDNTVTADVTDDDGRNSKPADSANVTVTTTKN